MTDSPRRLRPLGLALCLSLALPATVLPGLGGAAASPEPETAETTHNSVQKQDRAPRPARVSDERAIASLVRRMSLEQKVGQLFVQHFYGASATTPDQRNVPLYGVATPAEVIAKYHLGGVIYFGWSGNLTDPQQIAGLSNGLQRAAIGSGEPIPLQVATDQEQGPVIRFGAPATQLPGAMALGAGRSTGDSRRAAAITGSELKAVGIGVDYAPDADVNVNPANPVIGVRSFSSRPNLVSSMVAAQVKGFQNDAQVTATAKHFPGHGDTAVDSHTGLPVITHTRAQWRELDEPPFRAAIKAGVDQIMTAHLVVPALDSSGEPATLSRTILTDVLRKDLKFRGVVVTDSLAMEGVRTKYGDGEVAVRAIEAGADQLLMTPAMDAAYTAVLGAVRSGRISTERLDASVTRILQLKWKRGLFAQPYVDPARIDDVVGTPAHRAQADAIAERGMTLLTDEAGVVPFALAGRKVAVVGYGATATKTLAQEFTARGATATALETGSAPTPALIEQAVANATEADLAVVTTMNASTEANKSQRDLVAALQRTGTKVAVVAVRNPYDINALPGVGTYLAAYSYNAVSVRAAARVLLGEARATGRLPVDIPTADGAGVLYRFGAGAR
ncbi:glycoside hydrolase family 3 protein [Piscicoccus intestinalis]|uniref:glycoside hydrolase family 3 protein n=1 Tax=Piscicoccus intestinalis TaxID=746033 RepID=UPI000838BD96|nr:glycoside hydrolase family 3 protein [Piscicoccus intestinalis]